MSVSGTIPALHKKVIFKSVSVCFDVFAGCKNEAVEPIKVLSK